MFKPELWIFAELLPGNNASFRVFKIDNLNMEI